MDTTNDTLVATPDPEPEREVPGALVVGDMTVGWQVSRLPNGEVALTARSPLVLSQRSVANLSWALNYVSQNGLRPF